jgi:uncharacterized protein YndB with AHSA1/START domain
MIHIEGEIVINRPVEEVFDVVSDERNEPRYSPRLLWVEKISSGLIGRGTQFRAATKTMGRPVEMTIEFTDYQRPRRLGSSTHMPTMEIQGTLSFDPVPEGDPHAVVLGAAAARRLEAAEAADFPYGAAAGGNYRCWSQAVPGNAGGISPTSPRRVGCVLPRTP